MIDNNTMRVATDFGMAFEQGKEVGARVFLKGLGARDIMRLDFARRQDPTIFTPTAESLVQEAVGKVVRSKDNVERAKAQGITPEALYENDMNEMFEDFLPND